MKYKPILCKTAMHKMSKRFPYQWDVNIYRGCYHGCIYCYARYTHKYLGNDDFFDTIYYKKNIIEVLEKTLSSPKWKREIINIGGVSDCYQPIESKLQIMPEILKLLIKYKTPLIICTKSTLILRDIALIKQLADITYVNIAFTVTTLDTDTAKWIEPGASTPMNRLKVLKQFKEQTNASVGLHIMPIIPGITDSSQNLETLYHLASDIGVNYVLPGILYLRGDTKHYFLHTIKEKDIDLYYRLSSMYQGKIAKEYRIPLYQLINTYRKLYHINHNYNKDIVERLK